MKQQVHSMDEVKARLLGALPSLIARLGLVGERRGHEYVALNHVRGDKTLGSFSINLDTGIWRDFAGGEEWKGDAFQLVVMFAGGGDAKAAWNWALDFCGLTGKAPDPAKAAYYEQQAKKSRKDMDVQRAKLRAAAWRTMLDAKPLDGTDPASRYLMARAIDGAKLKEGWPRALRFHPSCYVEPGVSLPALLAFMTLDSEDRGFCGIHRIWLKQEAGIWTKAFGGDAAKKSLGTKTGACVRLTRGASGKQLKEAPAGEWVCLTEGIEDGLSIAMEKPDMRVLVSTTVSKLASVDLPPQLGGIYLFAQNDKPGSAADAATHSAALQLRAKFPVKLARVPRSLAKDPNEALQKMQQQQQQGAA